MEDKTESITNKLTRRLKKVLVYAKGHKIILVIVGTILLLLAGFIILKAWPHPSQPTNPQTVINSNKSTEATTNPLFGVPCKNDPKPVFVHDLTDPSQIDHIQIYGLGEIFPRFRSFLWIKNPGTKVPVYAPVDSDLVEAVYKNARGALDFDVHLMVSCQIWYLVNHITDPVDKIRSALPSTPATNTMDPPKVSPIVHFVAGELLGYTSGTPLASNWDFGVFDLTHSNQFVNQARYDQDRYGKFQTAICPLDVFPKAQKTAYYALIGESKPIAGAKCGPLSPDKRGTISGSWFDTAELSPDHSLHFKLMIGAYSDGVIRISGEDFQPSIEVPPTNATFLDPQLVNNRHCYSAAGKVVDFKMVNDQQTLVFSGSGQCGSSFPASGFKTYYR